LLDLNEVVTDTQRMLRRLIGEDIRLTTTLASGLGTVLADAGQIEQVFDESVGQLAGCDAQRRPG